MSRSLGSKWFARVGRDRVSLGRRGHLLVSGTAPASPAGAHELATAGDPLSAIDALGSLLAERASRGWGDSLEVVLDDDWAYHRVIEGDFRKIKAAQRRMLAQAYFVDALTVEQGGWSVCSELQPDGKSLLCCAISDILGNGLKSASEAHGLRLASVQTELSARMSVWATRLPEDALVLVCGSQHACLALRVEDSWKAIDTWSRTGSIAREVRSRCAALLHRSHLEAGQLSHHAWFENADDAEGSDQWFDHGTVQLPAPVAAFAEQEAA